MKIEDLRDMWDKDGQISPVDLTASTQAIPKLHNKYYNLYIREGLKLKKLRTDYKILLKRKSEWYRGVISTDELLELGWSQYNLKILRQDLPLYLDADDDLIKENLRIALQEAIVEFLESILKQINNRGFHIKAIIDWERFKVGA